MAKIEIKIQLATQQDIPSLIELFNQSEEFHRNNRPDVFAKPPSEEIVGLYGRFFQDPLSKILIAKRGEASEAFLRYRIYKATKVSLLVESGR